MAKKLLHKVKMGSIRCSSYLASAEGILRAADMWNQESYLLAGMTGIAFHFIVHERTCPSSVTIYDWQQHFQALDRIGICSDRATVFCGEGVNTADLYRNHVVKRIKESIDKGIGVVVWAPTPLLEFGIIKGYDDQNGVFFVEDCLCGHDPAHLLYENLGKSEVPLLSYQLIIGKKDVPAETTYRSSLSYGVQEWEKESFNPQYACGRKGYDSLIAALERSDYIAFGLAYIIFSYGDAKQHLARYLDYISQHSQQFGSLKKAAQLYNQVAQCFENMARLAPFAGPQTTIDDKHIPEILTLAREAKELEDQAMGIIKAAL